MGFAPNLSPENFKCAFTSAEGWGTFWQKRGAGSAECGLQVRWGQLRLKTMSLAVAQGVNPSTAKVLLGQTEIRAELKVADQRAVLSFADEILVTPEQELHITLA